MQTAPADVDAHADATRAAAVASGGVLQPDGSVVFSASASAADAPETPGDAVVQRAVDDQPEGGGGGERAPVPSDVPATVRAGDLEELARRLYPAISRRLQTELRLDRERVGQLWRR